MFKIHLIVLGKLKESYWRDAEIEYLKRLSAFAKIEIHELREESFADKDNPETVKEKEAQKIKEVLLKISNPFIVTLEIEGKEFSSTDFASRLKSVNEDARELVMIVGGPLGLQDSISKLSQLKLSLSKMTFTHQMVRVFLLEQIYRSFMISANRNYHY
jgi:23S rRNA (pseudouridine1915-N3)-methyltransferase